MISSMLTDLSWMNQQESNECVKKELYDAGIQIAWTATANDQISKCLKYIVEDIGIETIFGRWKIWDWKLFHTDKNWLAIAEPEKWISHELATLLNTKLKNTLRIDGSENGWDTYWETIDEYHIDTFEALRIFSLAVDGLIPMPQNQD